MYKSFLALVSALLLFTACSSPSNSGPTEVSELQLLGFVSGNGSNLTLNGQSLNLSGANISKDDSSSNSSSVQPGVELSAKGQSKDDGYQFSEVSVNSRIKGLVDSVDFTNASLEVVGVKVAVDALTVIVKRESDGSFSELTLADIGAGNYLEVHGAVQTNDSVIATRLELKTEDNSEKVELRMPIRNLDTSTQTFSFGLLNHVVDYSAANFSGNLAEGSMLRFKGSRSGNVISVTEMRNKGKSSDTGSGRLEIEGPVVGLDTSTKQFSVLGYTVDYSSSRIEGNLSEGARVEVKGSLDTTGILVASKVEVKHERGGSGRANGKIKGPLEALDLNTGIVTVNGSSFWTDGNSKLEKNDRHVSLSDFSLGDWVEIYSDSTRSNDQGFAYATKIETEFQSGNDDTDNPDDSRPGERELSGTISEFNASIQSFKIGRITVVVSSRTEYKILSQDDDDISASSFWSVDRSGATVKVEGSLEGTTLTAREIKIR